MMAKVAAERDVLNRQGKFVADFERHAASLENKTRAKSLFAILPTLLFIGRTGGKIRTA
jgi:hypothetical protein